MSGFGVLTSSSEIQFQMCEFQLETPNLNSISKYKLRITNLNSEKGVKNRILSPCLEF